MLLGASPSVLEAREGERRAGDFCDGVSFSNPLMLPSGVLGHTCFEQ